jgi:dephospho-CoA kinase
MATSKLPVIVLAGFSCAGKSTISKRLVDLYGFDLMEQYVIYSSIAYAKGYKRTRHWLAEVGNEVFVKETTLENVRRINAIKESKGVVIDASYGPVMDEILRSSLINAQIIVVAVKADEAMRAVRMAGRMGATDEEAKVELTFRDSFLSEVNLEEVLEKADFEVVNRSGVEDALNQLANELAKLGIPKP